MAQREQQQVALRLRTLVAELADTAVKSSYGQAAGRCGDP